MANQIENGRQPQGSGQGLGSSRAQDTSRDTKEGRNPRRSLRRGQRELECVKVFPGAWNSQWSAVESRCRLKTAMSPGCFLLKKCLHKESTITVENINRKKQKGGKN